jgi:PST family polysaccharide transporter
MQQTERADDGKVGARTVAGVATLGLSKLLAKFIDLGTLLFLARLLNQADFGVVALAMSPIYIVEAIVELPVSQVLLTVPTPTRSHYDTAFTLGLLRGVFIVVTLIVIGYGVSTVYRDPRLFGLLSVLSLAPALRGAANVYNVEFYRRMDFRRDFFIETSSKVAAFILSVWCAATTHSYWAIAVGTISFPVTALILSYAVNPKLPRFDLSERRLFLAILSWSVGAQAINAINWQSDKLLLGRFMPSNLLGRYSMAADVASFPEQTLVKTAMLPFQSAFSRSDSQIPKLKEMYVKSLTGIGFIGMPVMVGFSLTSFLSVPILLGAKWASSVPILEILSLSLVIPLFSAPLPALAASLRQNRVFLTRSTVELFLKIPILVAGLVWFGLQGVVFGRALTEVLIAILSMSLVRRLIGFPILEQAVALHRPFLASLGMAAMLLAIRVWGHDLFTGREALELVLLIFIGAGTYFGLSYALWWAVGAPDAPERQALDMGRSAWRQVRLRLAAPRG